MRERYMARLSALKEYILNVEKNRPTFKPIEEKNTFDVIKNSLFSYANASNIVDTVNDILQKYENIKSDIKDEYPKIYKDLMPKIQYNLIGCEIDYLQNIFKTIPETPEISLRKEGVFLNGQQFDAFVFIGNLISDADKKIRIIDNYINEEVLTILSHKKKTKEIEIEIMTSLKGAEQYLKITKDRFEKQYPNIQIKKTGSFHDRFVFIDECLYHFGCSLKDAGDKMFMFSKIEDQDIKKIINEKWDSEWSKSSNIV